MKMKHCFVICSFLVSFCSGTQAAKTPNVLFIAVDDLRDWVGHLNSIPKYSPQKTKLAKWLPSTNGEPKK